MQYGACRQEWNALLPTSESLLPVSEVIRNSRVLRRRGTHQFADCSRAWRRRERDRVFQNLGYNCLLSQYSTNSEEGLASSEVQIEIARYKLLTLNGEDCILRFS